MKSLHPLDERFEVAPTSEFHTYYGRAVAIEGDRAVVSTEVGLAPVLVYEKVGGSWQLTDQILDVDATGFDAWGEVLALDGDLLAISASKSWVNGVNLTGAVYLYRDGPQGWTREAVLEPGDPQLASHLGISVALDGDRVVAGAPFSETAVPLAGAAYVFERAGGVWGQTARLTGEPFESYGNFGRAVDVEGDRILVGHPGGASAGDPPGERVHVFELEQGLWTERRTLLSPVAGTEAAFGYVLGLEGDDAIVGAFDLDGAFENSGEAWVLDAGALCASPGSVSLAAGGAQTLDLSAGPSNAGLFYLVLGTASGTSPGTVVGALPLPLNPDIYTIALLASPGAPPLVNGLGTLDAAGAATAQVVVPALANPVLAGVVLHHATVVLDLGTGAVPLVSEAEALTLLP